MSGTMNDEIMILKHSITWLKPMMISPASVRMEFAVPWIVVKYV